ncbi:MAG: helix-turn-helix transcriptional regulator [Candidatus Sulfotelmatobacter sp.]
MWNSFLEDLEPQGKITRRDMANGRSSEAVVQGSGNVFADLGLRDAGEKQTRVRLAVAINQIIEAQRLSQAAAARLLDINQPKISALVNYRLEGFSVERLMHFLNALDRDVEIVIRKKPRSKRAARIVVTGAQLAV